MTHELIESSEQDVCPIGELCAASLGESLPPCTPNATLSPLPFAEDLCIQALTLASSRREARNPISRFVTASADLEFALCSEDMKESDAALGRAKRDIKALVEEPDLPVDLYAQVMPMDISMPLFESRQGDRDPTTDGLAGIHRGYGDFLDWVRTTDKYGAIDVGNRAGALLVGIFGCLLNRDKDPDDVTDVASNREHVTGKPTNEHHSFYRVRDAQKIPLKPRMKTSHQDKARDRKSPSILVVSYVDLVRDAAKIARRRGVDMRELASSISTGLIAEARGEIVEPSDAAVITVMGMLLEDKIDAFKPKATRTATNNPDKPALAKFL
jgi:hypothetical protein